LRDVPRTLIFYESPKRITGLMGDLLAVMGDRSAALGREITKLHEEFLRGRLSELAALLENRQDLKGECTLVVSGSPPGSATSAAGLSEKLTNRLKQKRVILSELVREVVRETGLPRKVVYGTALEIKRKLNQGDKTDGSA
jgi:16S rRNA (cytidine1402-2'-O)-methyltransferase